MHAEFRSPWPRTIALPLGLLVVPVLLSLVSYGEYLIGCAPVAFAIGIILNPRRLWPIWIGAIVVMWVSYGTATLLHLPAVEGGGEETVGSFMFEAVIFMAVLVLLPLWLGRLVERLRARIDHEEMG
jgi:hypothetical protein